MPSTRRQPPQTKTTRQQARYRPTKRQRNEAMDIARRFAIKTMINDFGDTDLREIATVADGYAKEFWRDWVEDTRVLH